MDDKEKNCETPTESVSYHFYFKEELGNVIDFHTRKSIKEIMNIIDFAFDSKDERHKIMRKTVLDSINEFSRSVKELIDKEF